VGFTEFTSTLAQECGTFTIEGASAFEPPSDTASVIQVTMADERIGRIPILMYFSPPLTQGLNRHSKDESRTADIGSPTRSVGGIAGRVIPEQINLKLVMDVELNVTLRFGQRQLTLREVLELIPGSVVELDRQVEEPVELLLNGKVIARGEAVVIDGNYGLRVTEVSESISVPTRR